MRFFSTTVIVAAFAASGCTGVIEPIDAVELRTEVEPALVQAGGILTLRAILRNPTSVAVEPGVGCGPPVLFELRNQAGDVVHPIPLNGAFTCPYLDYHLLQPQETDTVEVQWRVTVPSGTWAVRSGFRSAPGLARLTPPVNLTVNPDAP